MCVCERVCVRVRVRVCVCVRIEELASFSLLSGQLELLEKLFTELHFRGNRRSFISPTDCCSMYVKNNKLHNTFGLILSIYSQIRHSFISTQSKQ